MNRSHPKMPTHISNSYVSPVSIIKVSVLIVTQRRGRLSVTQKPQFMPGFNVTKGLARKALASQSPMVIKLLFQVKTFPFSLKRLNP